mgnify:CR=1 FL=1
MTTTLTANISSFLVPDGFKVTADGVFLCDEDDVKQLTTVAAWVSLP